jgi:hypothetical protein
MSFVDKVGAAVAPPESEEKRREARTGAGRRRPRRGLAMVV